MNIHDRRASLTSVSIDNFGGAIAVTGHLLSQGYKRIAHVCGPDERCHGHRLPVSFKEANLRVPQDIAPAGFDDIPIARFVMPPLTTVRVNTTELGGRALDRLAVAIEHAGGARPPSEMLATEFVIRASTGTHDVVRSTDAAIPIRRARKDVSRP